MRRIALLTLFLAAVFAIVPGTLSGRIVAQDPDDARQQAPLDLTPPAPKRAEPRPGVAPDALTTMPPVEVPPGVPRARPDLPASAPLTGPPGGERGNIGPDDVPPARPRPAPGTIGVQGGAPGSVAYTAGATITFHASDLGTVQIVSIVFTPGFTYRFYDSGGIVAGTGCVAATAVEADCSAPNAVLIVSNLHAGADNYFQDGLDGIDGLNVFGGSENDQLTIGGAGFAVPGPSYVQGDAGDDTAVFSDPSTSSAQTYTITTSSVARSSAGSMGYATERVRLNAGTGADTIAVNSTSGATEVDPGAGEANSINVGSGNLDNIGGQVTVQGNSADVLSVNDSAVAFSDTYGITATTFARGFFAGLSYAGVGTLNIFGQTSGNTWTVAGTGPITTLNGGAGNDTVTVGPNLDSLDTTLDVNMGAGIDSLTINDYDNGINDTITVTATSMMRFASGGVTFNTAGDVENLTVETQEVGSAVYVQSTSVPSTVVNGRGGDDLFSVGGGFMDNLFATAVVNGGSGAGGDTLFVDDTANGFNDFYTITTDVINRNSSAGVQFAAFESAGLFSGLGNAGFAVSSTSPIPYFLGLGDGNDFVSTGPDQSLLTGELHVEGGVGSDTIEYSDTASLTANAYEIRGGQRIDRVGLPALQYSSIEADVLIGGINNDVIRLLSTTTGTNTTARGYLGNDTAQLFAAGLASIGAATLYGGADNDTLAVYSGGLGSFLIPPDTVSTPGRHNVLHFEFETTGISATGTDSDGDSCPDAFEIGIDENFGGLRNPSDFYDWFDVADASPPPAPDRAIDLNDALSVLSFFGSLPGDAGYSPIYDRVAGPVTQPWRTRPATGLQVGIDLQDALVALQSFGHLCQ